MVEARQHRVLSRRPGLSPAFVRSRAITVVELADRAEEAGKSAVRKGLEDIIAVLVKRSLKGKLDEDIISRLSIGITPAEGRQIQ